MNRAQRRLFLGGLSFLDSLAAEQADVVELSPPPEQRLLVGNPEAIGQIFRADRQMHLAGSDTLRPLVGDRSLLFANGTRHAAYRQSIGPELRGNALRRYHSTIADTTHAAIRTLASGSVIELTEWTRKITLNVIGTIVLGPCGEDLLHRFSTWVDGALGSVPRTLLYRYLRTPVGLPTPWRTFLRRREVIDRDVLHRARSADRGGTVSGTPCGTLAGLLTSGREPLGRLDDDDLRDQLVSLLFAGHETTASATAWTLFWLERHPQVLADVREELAATTSEGSNAKDVPLLDAVCRESLRLTPPATLAGNRVLTEDWDLLGRPTAAGTRLTPSIYLVHRRPDVHPDPLRFDPGRFLGTRMPAQDYLPFGGGLRRCLGADFAMLELRMIVAAVLRSLDLRCVNPRRGVPQLRGAAMGPKPGLRMEVRHVRALPT
ncbi:cytochrome P450 [Micromonospora olivasterospora]|uniref:Cytochrome P450 n=1 Tax=Micromonospora olivasterospora TaxID=1880 RepID=A0A562I2G9_MICOL|nr:cytochrome P450 [Micromonospora olivasterospora]TWH65237.1 cytochrome P450 [Micromonospora olivasterospora]